MVLSDIYYVSIDYYQSILCAFYHVYRVDPADTYYTGVCDNGDMTALTLTPDSNVLPSYCYCNVNGSETCSPGNDVYTCPYMLKGEKD